ncbi:MAG: O-methyltransferase [Candidatus Limnocylindrales bacterium]
MKPRDYVPGQADLDYIEAAAARIDPALAAIEAAAEPEGIPILDRASGRVLSILASGHRSIVEVGTAYGYSTLCMALGQPRDGRIVTIDPDRVRTGLARGWWRQAGIADERIVVVSRPALEAFAADEPALAGPFDLAFIDALKPEYGAYLVALRPRLATGALVVADNVLWGGALARPGTAEGDSANAEALRRFNAATLGDEAFSATILPIGDGLLLAVLRG